MKTKIFLQKGLDRRFGDLSVAGFVIWITRWSMSYFEQAAVHSPMSALAHYGLKSDCEPSPKSAITGSQPSRLIYPIGGIALRSRQPIRAS
jgi:hypothetical protein